MKPRLFFLFLFTISGILSAQDTIFVRNGQVIPAVIVEKNNTEVKYKKYGMPEPAAVYSLFTTDILSIHYKNGIIADYTQPGQEENVKPKTAPEMAGSVKSISISIGLGACYFARNASPDFEAFWKYQTGNDNAQIERNSYSIPIIIKFSLVFGQNGRNWFGDKVQLTDLPRAIYATENGGASQIRLKDFYCDDIIFYGRTLNYKKNLAAIIESGMDLEFGLNGYIKLINKTYNNIAGNNSPMSVHLALGADWVISKRLTADFRFGYRFQKDAQFDYYNGPSDWGELQPKASVSGPYLTVGLCWNFYIKMKYERYK